MAMAMTLALASGTAAALGLGQIQLKSKLGEPLLAEIPIVSVDPTELEQLRAGLASPETFARVGLQPPDGIVSHLQFVPALDGAGNAVIRVTSAQPISQPLLTFLIEVDWGQGRLVREYSTLLDAPRTVSAPLQPPIEAPVLAPSNAIVRAPSDSGETAPADETEPLASSAAPETDSAVPAPASVPVAAVAESPAAPVPRQRPTEYGAVVRGETLSEIATRLDMGASLDQAMIALLRANPDAFINGNINLLKQGAVLRVPQREEVQGLGRAEASALVRAQVQQWRDARRPVPQPAAIAGAAAPDAAASIDTSAQAVGGARLEIVPPGASRAARAGTQSGITAGGEGEMLRQELQQTRETLAARDAELAEMQSRVAELEKLQGAQQQLLSMKDTELAAVQQRLAKAQEATASTPPAEARAASAPWIMGGAGLLLLALLGGWLMRRRAAAPRFTVPPTPRPSLADAFAPARAASDMPPPEAGGSAGQQAIEAARAGEVEAVAPEQSPLPFWDRRERSPAPNGRRQVPAVGQGALAGAAPAWHGAAGAPTAVRDPAEPAGSGSDGVAGQQRLELARACLDLGDHDSARQLLDEVVVGGNPDDSRQAMRMLRELE